MAVLYITAGIAALFAAVFSVNVSLRVIFSSSKPEETNIYVKIGFYKIFITPAKQKQEKKEKKKSIKNKAEKKSKKKDEVPQKEKKRYKIPDIFEFIKNIGSVFFKRLKKHFKIKIYKINIITASNEAEKTALLYGGAVQSAYYLYELLNHNFKIKKKPDAVLIAPDFTAVKTNFETDIKFCMRISHIIALLISLGIKFLVFQKNQNK